MDFLNLTINMQSPQQSTALIGAAIIGALITGAASLVIAIYNDLKGAKNKKIQVYSNLMGQRQTSAGYLFSYFTNSISHEYLISRSYIIGINSIDYEKMKKIKQKEGPERANQQAMKIINSSRNKSVEHRSALRAEEKIDHYLIQSRENDKRLYIILGQIRVSFSGKSETNNLVKKIQEAEKIFPEFERDVLNSFQFFRNSVEKKAGRMKSNAELNQFFYEIIPQIMFLDNMKKKELHNIIDDFESKIDNLLTYLEPEVTQCFRQLNFDPPI